MSTVAPSVDFTDLASAVLPMSMMNANMKMDKSHSSDLGSMILQMIPMLVFTFLLQQSKEFWPFITAFAKSLAAEWLGQCKRSASKALVPTTITIAYSANGSNRDANEYNAFYAYRALVEFVTRNKLYSINNKFILGAGEASAVNSFKYEESRSKLLIPFESIVYNGITMQFELPRTAPVTSGADAHGEKQPKENADERRYSLVLSSTTKSQQEMLEFIAQQIGVYNRRNYDNVDSLQFFMPENRFGDPAVYRKYRSGSHKTFANTFFPEKPQVMRLLDRLKSKEKTKATFLFHGAPGTGKTSTLKAIANYTNRHVIVIKLSLIRNDNELMRVLHDEKIRTNEEDMKIPLSDRIYVLEDIDAETEVVFDREKKLQETKKKLEEPGFMNGSMHGSVPKPYQDLTLSGILNALDGFLELNNTVVVITTNHREKLDPAFTRPGRIDMEIEFKKMSSLDCEAMIRQHFKIPADTIIPFRIPDDVVTACQLEGRLQRFECLQDVKAEDLLPNVIQQLVLKSEDSKEEKYPRKPVQSQQQAVMRTDIKLRYVTKTSSTGKYRRNVTRRQPQEFDF